MTQVNRGLQAMAYAATSYVTLPTPGNSNGNFTSEINNGGTVSGADLA